MGLRGPQPKSKALRDAQGNPGRIQIHEHTPIPPPGVITPPKWVTGAALDIWNDAAPVMIAMRTLTTADRIAFGRYCVAVARYVELKVQHWDKGPMGTLYPLKDKKGKLRHAGEWPQASELRKLHEILSRLEDRFGGTPAARTRLHVAPPLTPTSAAVGQVPPTFKISAFNQHAGPQPPRPVPKATD